MTSLESWSALFDAWAGQDPLIASTGEPSNPEELASVGQLLAEWMQLDGTQRALDVGCASGTLTATWAPEVRHVTGVDYSLALLRDARAAHGAGNLTLVRADGARLPFSDGRFDCVCSYAMLLCLPDPDWADRALEEILRVTRPGGRAVIGGLPDTACRNVFFDHCDAMSPWYRRAIPRGIRWSAKRVLGGEPGRTKILWFDVEALAARLRRRGYRVLVEYDPELSNYAAYRKTLIVSGAPSEVREP